MPWLIGIDEAGYGPNLGPFVMTSVACRLAEAHAGADMWALLRAGVRRSHEGEDERLVIDDSKLVYGMKNGLVRLELSVLGTVLHLGATAPLRLTDCLNGVAPAQGSELARESWFTGTTELPLAVEWAALTRAAGLFGQLCADLGVHWGIVRSVLVCPTRFNQIVTEWGTKGAVLGQALAELLQANLRAEIGSEPVAFSIDKHGGRNTYAAMLQDAVPEGFVFAEEESHAQSRYQILGTGREVRVTFRPRADASHFCVALASMVSKYLREVLMREFNCFWQQHVPELKPTSGYPADAGRFYQAIRPAMQRLGLAEDSVWRRK